MPRSLPPNSIFQKVTKNDQEDFAQPENQSPPKRFARTRKSLRFVLAVDTWKRSLRYTAQQFTLPFARQVITSGLRQQKASIRTDLWNLSNEVVARSLFWHRVMQWVFVPLFLWSLLVCTRGIAALLKLGELTPFLFYGVAGAFLLGCQIFISSKSAKAFAAEQLRRTQIVDPPEKEQPVAHQASKIQEARS